MNDCDVRFMVALTAHRIRSGSGAVLWKMVGFEKKDLKRSEGGGD